jgi:hypothetical protein
MSTKPTTITAEKFDRIHHVKQHYTVSNNIKLCLYNNYMPHFA